MNLVDLFPNFYVENGAFDCKAKLNRENTLSWMKTVCGFSNAEGGTLFIGVEEESFKLIGFDQAEADKEKLFFYNEIRNHSSIVPSYKIEAIPYKINDAIRFILKIEIMESDKKPMIIKYDGMPMIFVRRDGFTNAATEEEIRMMILSSNHPSFDDAITDIDFNIDDFKKYREFYKERTGKDLILKELESINFVKNGKLTNGGYLFSDLYNGNKTKIVCSLYQGTTRGDNLVISSNTYSGNLIDSYYFMNDFIKSRMNHSFIKLDDRRIDQNSYPDRAIFEAIINALAHRDYLLDGTQINVDMFSNRLVISSPGSLFEGKSNLTPTYDLSSFSSKRRNEVICNAFIIAKAMEAKGTGFEKIAADYSQFDKKHQPFIYSKNNTFYITLPDLTNPNGVYMDEESIYVVGLIENPTRFDVSVLSFCYLNKRSIKEITEYLNLSNSSFFRNSVINNLVSQGFLTEFKEKNTTLYTTNIEKIKVR